MTIHRTRQTFALMNANEARLFLFGSWQIIHSTIMDAFRNILIKDAISNSVFQYAHFSLGKRDSRCDFSIKKI